MAGVVNAVYFDVQEDEAGDWFLRWADGHWEDDNQFGWILWGDNGAIFEPVTDDFSLNMSELSELAGLLRMFERKG